MNMTSKTTQLTFLLLLAAVVAASLLIFSLKLQYDNKYTAPGPQAKNGVLDLSVERLPPSGLLFLWDGWEVYQYQFLTPGELHSAPAYPSAYMYLGQYGGFELGNPGKSPHGCATYRLTVRTGGPRRSYMLETPEIYGDYKLWVNGALLSASPGVPAGADAAGSAAGAAAPFIVFEAQDQIEIIVAVEDDSHFYSGMVYPPALGSPEAVWRLLTARMALSGVLCAVAVLSSLFYLFLSLRIRRGRQGTAYALFCLCFAGSVSCGAALSFFSVGDAFYLVSQACHYGVFCSLLLLLGEVCSMPALWKRAAGAAGMLMCLAVVLFPFFMGHNIGAMLALSRFVAFYKYACALCFLFSALWAFFRKRPYARPVLTGACVFSLALTVDRLFPVYEPILINWPVETACIAVMLLVGVTLIADTVNIYTEKNRLHNQKEAALRLARAQARQYAVLAVHLRQLREAKHEMRSCLLTLKYNLEQGRPAEAGQLLDRYLGRTEAPAFYTQNQLINSVLTTLVEEARQKGISVDCELAVLPVSLPFDAIDLCSLLTNILQNAIEACAKIPSGNGAGAEHRAWDEKGAGAGAGDGDCSCAGDGDEPAAEAGNPRRISLTMRMRANVLYLSCHNTMAVPPRLGPGSRINTSKANPELHGYGLRFIKEVSEKYGGSMDIEHDESSFTLYVSLRLPGSADA